MKIGFVTRELPPSLRVGGIGTYVWDLSKRLVEQGHQVVVIAASDDISKGSIDIIDGIKIIRLKGGDFFLSNTPGKLVTVKSQIRKFLNFYSYRKKVSDCIENLIDNNEIEIVEFPEYGNEAFLWSRLKRRIPLVVRLHTPAHLERFTGKRVSWFSSPIKRIFGEFELFTLAKADGITSPSQAMAAFTSNYSNIPMSGITIIPNAVNISQWSGKVHSEKILSSSEIKIFSAGSVTPGKGFEDLVEAIRVLRKRGLKIELTIAGKLGKLGRQLQVLPSQDPEYTGWLKIIGQIPRNELQAYYQQSDLVVFPSWWENFPMVLIEAMASKALVLGSTEGGMSEIIDDGVDGFLVKPKAPIILADKVFEILELSNRKKKILKEAAVKKVLNKLDTFSVTQNNISFYKKIVDFST